MLIPILCYIAYFQIYLYHINTVWDLKGHENICGINDLKIIWKRKHLLSKKVGIKTNWY